MEARLREVEKAVVRIEATLPHLATKDDLRGTLASTESTLIRWFVGTAVVLTSLVAVISFGAASLL